MDFSKELEELKKEVPEFRTLDLSRIYIEKGNKTVAIHLPAKKASRMLYPSWAFHFPFRFLS